MTPLHYSADSGHNAVVKHLVDHGAAVDILDKQGEYRAYQSWISHIDVSYYHIGTRIVHFVFTLILLGNVRDF